MPKNVTLTVDTRITQIILTKQGSDPVKAEARYSLYEVTGLVSPEGREYRPATLPASIQAQLESLWTAADAAVRAIEGT